MQHFSWVASRPKEDEAPKRRKLRQWRRVSDWVPYLFFVCCVDSNRHSSRFALSFPFLSSILTHSTHIHLTSHSHSHAYSTHHSSLSSPRSIHLSTRTTSNHSLDPKNTTAFLLVWACLHIRYIVSCPPLHHWQRKIDLLSVTVEVFFVNLLLLQYQLSKHKPSSPPCILPKRLFFFVFILCFVVLLVSRVALWKTWFQHRASLVIFSNRRLLRATPRIIIVPVLDHTLQWHTTLSAQTVAATALSPTTNPHRATANSNKGKTN